MSQYDLDSWCWDNSDGTKPTTFTDNDVEDGISYFYYLEDVAFDGPQNKSLVIQASLRSDLARKHLARWATLKQ